MDYDVRIIYNSITRILHNLTQSILVAQYSKQ